MKAILKKFGIVGGGTAAACAACCAAPVVAGPLLAWLGVAGLGAAFSPWYLLLLAAPVLMLGLQHLRRKTADSCSLGPGGCGSKPATMPPAADGKPHGGS